MKVVDAEGLNMSETLIVKKLKRNRQINVYSALVCLFFMCALRRTFLKGESPKSALVVGRI